MLLYAERVPQVQRNAESRNHRTDTQRTTELSRSIQGVRHSQTNTSRLGTNLFGRRKRSASGRTARAGLCSQRNTERAKAEIRQAGRRRSHCRESTASYRDRLLKKIESLNSGRGTPKQKAQVVQELRQNYPLKPLLQLAKLPRSTFYYY